MNNLFYQLMHNPKTRRWFIILDILEEKQSVTAKELAIQTNYSKRTIQADIKGIKRDFETSILVLGDDHGYHFSFKNPAVFTKKKQKLLENEPLFLFLDQLLDENQRSNQEWAEVVALPISSFSRIKRSLVGVLEKHYQVKIGTAKNRLMGDEASIRQLMYDFYFTLPIYPKALEEKVETLRTYDQSIASGRWCLDPILVNRWLQLANWRIKQGYALPKREDMLELEQKLVVEVEQLVKTSLPSQEKAALFLLSLKEEQFVNPLIQKEFIRHFSPAIGNSYPVMDLESMTVHLFDTLIYLMNHFFQLPSDLTVERSEANQTREKIFLKQLMTRYLEVKKRLQKPLLLSFELTGTAALQQWIKETVCQRLRLSGYHLIKKNQAQNMLFVHQLKITNEQQIADDLRTVFLSKIPEEKEISQRLKQIAP